METQYCPQCGTANSPGFRYCQSCGASLGTAQSPAAPPPAASVAQPAVSTAYAHGTTSLPYAPPPSAYAAHPVGQMGASGLSAVDIWGPFAGYGERGRHVSWLLDNLGDRAEALYEATLHRFQQRQIPGAWVEPRVLTGKGIAVERRPYHLIRRGVATAGLYIARFGQDLYISQVTYAKGAINPLRVAILALMVLFQIYFIFGYTGSVEAAVGSFDLMSGYSGGSGNSLGALLCCIGPLGLLNTAALSLAGLHMIYKFLTEKDPLMLLRTPPNEFQQDDIIALEKAVEETVRQSMDSVGIDATLMPPATEYGLKRRLI